MEKTSAKIFQLVVVLSFLSWLGIYTYRTLLCDHLLQFGAAEFKTELAPEFERSIYTTIAKYSILLFAVYPITIFSAVGYLKTTRRTMKEHGWLMMSAILFFMFIPLEIYCALLDWKIIGLNYWGNWELIEFRKAFLARITALSGLPFLAMLCYYTIIPIVIFQPLKKYKREKISNEPFEKV